MQSAKTTKFQAVTNLCAAPPALGAPVSPSAILIAEVVIDRRIATEQLGFDRRLLTTD